MTMAIIEGFRGATAQGGTDRPSPVRMVATARPSCGCTPFRRPRRYGTQWRPCWRETSPSSPPTCAAKAPVPRRCAPPTTAYARWPRVSAPRWRISGSTGSTSAAMIAAVETLTVMLLDGLTRQFGQDYYHRFFLAQPALFPENMIGHDPPPSKTRWSARAALNFLLRARMSPPRVHYCEKIPERIIFNRTPSGSLHIEPRSP